MAIRNSDLWLANLRAFGEPVTVSIPYGAVFTRTMLFDDDVEESTALGTLQGHIGTPVFYCLPEDDALIQEGALLTRSDGSEYKVFAEPIRRAGQMTAMRVNEQ